jgi:aminopeptidase 2
MLPTLSVSVLYSISLRASAGSKVQLRITYDGLRLLTRSMVGCDKSTGTVGGNMAHHAMTHLQVRRIFISAYRNSTSMLIQPTSPHRSRSEFPCRDEPALKATFAVSLISGSKDIDVSNMPVGPEENLSATTVKSTLSGNSTATVALVSTIRRLEC